MLPGSARGPVLEARDAQEGRRTTMMKQQLVGIGVAVTMSYLLFVIRHLLLTRGRSKKILCRAYLLRLMDDWAGPGRDDYLRYWTPYILNSLGMENHLRPPQSKVSKAGGTQARASSNKRKGDRTNAQDKRS
jgi:hypothetical protein